jgi:hypothetical protein
LPLGLRSTRRSLARIPWAQRGPAGQVTKGWDLPARHGDSEAERWLGAATRGGVLTGEGVGGDVNELWGLRGAEREMRAASIGEGKAQRGHSSERGRRWHFGVKPRWASSMNEEGGGVLGLR